MTWCSSLWSLCFNVNYSRQPHLTYNRWTEQPLNILKLFTGPLPHAQFNHPSVYQNVFLGLTYSSPHTHFSVRVSYSGTHIVNNSNHKTNMPWPVWFSFYLFRSYHHHMHSAFTLAHPEHCSFVDRCRQPSQLAQWPASCLSKHSWSGSKKFFVPSAGVGLDYRNPKRPFKVVFSFFWQKSTPILNQQDWNECVERC